jgi:Protein of unknown function (DUF3631)
MMSTHSDDQKRDDGDPHQARAFGGDSIQKTELHLPLDASQELTIEQMREVADRLFSIAWDSSEEGFMECPGIKRHTTGNARRDCKVHLAGGKPPTIYCFHNSCSDVIESANRDFRSELGKASLRTVKPRDRKQPKPHQLNPPPAKQPLQRCKHALKPIPVPDRGLPPNDQMEAHIRACFQDGDIVNIVLADSNGKPANAGIWLDWPCTDKVPDSEHGTFVRVNPMSEGDASNTGVTDYRHVLLECDQDENGKPISKELQWAAIFASGLPCSSVADSGGKSLHSLVRVDASTPEEYRERAKQAADALECFSGIKVDRACLNPSRLSRLAGCRRGDAIQTLVALNIGALDWAEWAAIQADAASQKIGELLDKIVTHLRRYIVFQSDSPYRALSLWVAHTYVIEAFEYTPYLHVYSPEKRCGKTLVQDVLSLLVPRPWSMANPSAATLFRKIEKDTPTLLWDEIDAVFSGGVSDPSKDDLRGLLNHGFQRGKTIPRCVPPNQDVKDFAVFCPKVIAGIGGLPDTISDRCIPIRLERKKKSQVTERFRLRDAKVIAEPLQTALEDWAADLRVIGQLQIARPTMPEEFGDRQMDITEPLLAIADMAGGRWPAEARAALLELFRGAKTESDSDGITLLRDIKKVFEDEGLNQISSKTLLEKLTELPESPWAGLWAKDIQHDNIRGPAGKMAKLLKEFGIASKTLKFVSEADSKGYMESAFFDAWERYL